MAGLARIYKDLKNIYHGLKNIQLRALVIVVFFHLKRNDMYYGHRALQHVLERCVHWTRLPFHDKELVWTSWV